MERVGLEAVYLGELCDKCNRKHGESTTLNIEGHIHHKLGFVCMDNKSCRRAQRRIKK